MNMPINHPITLSEQSKITTEKNNDGVGDNINDIMSDLSNIIFQMNILFKKMRDLLNTYNQKQQMLGWDIQITSMSNKREAISHARDGAFISGICSVVSGGLGFLGAGSSVKVGEVASHAASALGQLSVGGGKIREGDLAREADLQRMTSDLQSSSAQSYNKNISELLDKINESRQNMKDLGNSINNMMGQIAMAVKL